MARVVALTLVWMTAATLGSPTPRKTTVIRTSFLPLLPSRASIHGQIPVGRETFITTSPWRNSAPPVPAAFALAAAKRDDNDDEKKKDIGSIETGYYGLALATLLSAWLFTIPPEFRRAYICPSEYFCRTDPTQCERECVTWSDWKNGVADYYKGGGGIQWDFSIDPATVEKNEAKVQAIRSAAAAGSVPAPESTKPASGQ